MRKREIASEGEREVEIAVFVISLFQFYIVTGLVISMKYLLQCLKKNQRAALAEIVDVLRAVCHAHRLPLALTWIPCCYSFDAVDEVARVRVKENNINPEEKFVLCIEETACYVNDKSTQGFVHACLEHHLEEGQGIAGKALQSNHPFFYPDVKAYDINKYPLVHHARKFGLNAAVAIRLRSMYTGNDDYILEFFLPVNMKGAAEQQLLLNNLSVTMQRMCRSLRTVSKEELIGAEDSVVDFQSGLIGKSTTTSMRNSQSTVTDSETRVSNSINNGAEAECPEKQVILLLYSYVLLYCFSCSFHFAIFFKFWHIYEPAMD